jgi:phospholipid transport system substrate-binding protein
MNTFHVPGLQSLAQGARRRFLLAVAGVALLGATLSAPVHAAAPDAKASPEVFIKQVADQALAAIQADEQAKGGSVAAVNSLVNQYLLPYVNFEKTTRLAAGRHWREANATQQSALTEAFRGTLVRTYSGALRQVTPQTSITIMPFRGDANADDVVVRTQIRQPNTEPVPVDYRLEKTPQGWKVYDLNVMGVWLIQNYRNQFAQQIQQGGVDGLIKALSSRNTAS